MSAQIGYLYRCLREWQMRFGAWAGTRIWLSVRLRKTFSSHDQMTLLLPGMALIRLRCRGSDLACFEQIVVRDEPFRMSMDPNLIIDAGANVGLATAVLANRFPDATIVALEIDAQHFGMLRANTEHYRNVIPLNKALLHGNGHVKIANPPAAAWSLSLH